MEDVVNRLALIGVAGLTLACSAPAAQACWDGAGFGYRSDYSYAPRSGGYGYRPYYSGYYYGYGPRRWAYGYGPYRRAGYGYVGFGFW
jgi:hypothetical protein